MLTIITPVYCTSNKDYLFERVLWFIRNSFVSDEIQRIVVDYASPKYIADIFRKECECNGIQYIELKKYGELFSAGQCRNIGVSLSKTEFVTFQDVDLYASDETYTDILTVLKNMHFYNDIEIVPCLYLSEDISNKYFEITQDKEALSSIFRETYNKYLYSDKDILMFAPVTSTILIRRTFFMEAGGNNLEFQGHGYEDFESLHRLASMSNKFIKPIDYYNHDYKYHSAEYKGYRTYFSLFGRRLMDQKTFFVHLWHPKNESPTYTKRNHYNRELFNRLVRAFDRNYSLPPVLTDLSINKNEKETTLVLAPQKGKTAASLRVAIPHLGSVVYAHDKDFSSVKDFAKFLTENRVTRVLFFNSYANDFRYELYRYCLSKDVKTINFDRGALPNSWFFDPNGFNFSSTSYARKKWGKTLSQTEKIDISTYINEVLVSSDELESNGTRIGNYSFKDRYDIDSEKVLFVPLQRPTDSVIRHFSGGVSGVEEFLEKVDILAKSLSDEWIVLVKQHPLEPSLSTAFKSKNIKVMRDNDHFKDALSISSAVLLINSGVGIYSLMFGKPTFNIGDAFYSFQGLSNKIQSLEELPEKLDKLENYIPQEDVLYQFIHFLVNKFYSFGDTVYELESSANGTNTKSARYIDFNILRIPISSNKLREINITRRIDNVPLHSPYYNYYRSWILLRDKLNDSNNNKQLLEKIEMYKQLISNLEKKANEKNLIGMQSSDRDLIATNQKKDENIKKGRKLKKLRRSPKLFFSDAFKNIFK